MGYKEDITKIYVGYYDRAPDPAGLQYWIDRAEAGMTLAEIAQSFSVQSESTAKYPYLATPDVVSAESFIVNVYNNLFNRAPDDAGKAYWLGELAGGKPVGQMIIDIMSGATDSAEGNDKTILENKVAVGIDFASDVGTIAGLDYENNAAAKAAAAAALNGVDDTDQSVTDAKAATDAFVTDNPTQGQTFTLKTTPADALQGTDNADTFDATVINSLAAGDTIDGKGGDDVLNAKIAGGAGAPVVVSVEEINIESVGNSSIDATNMGTGKFSISGTASTTTTISDLQDGASLSLSSAKHSVTLDPLTDTAKNALNVELMAGGDHGTLTVNGTGDYDALTLDSKGGAANTVTIGSAMNEGTGTAADPFETTTVTGDQDLTIKGTSANLSGASIDASGLAASNKAEVNVTGATTAFSGARLTDIDLLSFSNTGGFGGLVLSSLAEGQHVQLNNNATGNLTLGAKGITTADSVKLTLNDADIGGTVDLAAAGAFDVEKLTIESTGAANTITGAVTLTAQEGATLTIVGDQNLTLGATLVGPAGDKGVIDASAMTGKLIMGAAANDDIETIKGGSGNDTLNGTADGTRLTIDGGAGDDIITVTGGSTGEKVTILTGAGDNVVNLSAAEETVNLLDGGKDTLQFVDAVTADSDIIANFQTGSDKLSFDGMTGISATTGTAVDASGAAIVVADDSVVTVSGGANLAAPTTVNAALATALDAELDFGASENSIVVYNDAASGNAFVYHIQNDGTAALAAGEIELIATVSNSTVAAGDIA